MFSRLLYGRAVGVLLGLSLVLGAEPLAAKTICDGIWKKSLSEGNELIRQVRKTTGSPLHVYEHMRVSSWHIVWIESDDSEPGAHFIRNVGNSPALITNWGGVASEDEMDEIYDWAIHSAQSLPPTLGKCFAWYVTKGRYLSSPTRTNPFNRAE